MIPYPELVKFSVLNMFVTHSCSLLANFHKYPT